MLFNFFIPFKPLVICFFKTLYVFLFFFSVNVSPIQNITFKFSFFSKNLPLKGIKEGIILDMVGDKQLSLPIERYSLKFHGKLVRQLWNRAKVLDLKAFKRVVGSFIYDDHVPLNQYAGIPTIDIIDIKYPNSFTNYWHTMNDIPENCSAESLQQVGTLMVDYIYNRKFYN